MNSTVLNEINSNCTISWYKQCTETKLYDPTLNVTVEVLYLSYEAGHFVAIESVGDTSVDIVVGHFSTVTAISIKR